MGTASKAEQRRVKVEDARRVQCVEVAVGDIAAKNSTRLLEEIAFVLGVEADPDQREFGAERSYQRKNRQAFFQPMVAPTLRRVGQVAPRTVRCRWRGLVGRRLDVARSEAHGVQGWRRSGARTIGKGGGGTSWPAQCSTPLDISIQ